MAEPSVLIASETSALLLIDVQPDFMPGGALPIAEGDQIVPALKDLMRSGWFRHQVATQDWHPRGHISFASSHPGRGPLDVIELYGHDQVLWPDHCVQGSPGAALHEGLALDRLDAIVRKGTDPRCDSYSGFRNNWNAQGLRPPTGLAGYLRERGVRTLYLAGLARDVCVKWTAEDGVGAGFEVYVLWDLTRPVVPDCDNRVRSELLARGVRLITSDQLAA